MLYQQRASDELGLGYWLLGEMLQAPNHRCPEEETGKSQKTEVILGEILCTERTQDVLSSISVIAIHPLSICQVQTNIVPVLKGN